MKPLAVSTFLALTIVFFGCKTSQNDSFITAKKEKHIVLTEVQAPHILFLLETGDTLKFSSRETSSLIEKQVRNETKSQGYLSNQDLNNLSEILKRITNDTLVVQKLSAVNNKTLGGVLDTWIARKLMLKGKVQVALKDQLDRLRKMKYIFIKDNLGGQQGTFFTEEDREIYWTMISLGE